MTENEIRINETTMWREWITVRGLEPITLQDIDDRLAELKQQVKVEPEVKVQTADDKYLYWKSTVIQDDDLRYGDKPKKQYFETICFDNQQTIVETSIKLKADNLEIGTVVEIYLPNKE